MYCQPAGNQGTLSYMLDSLHKYSQDNSLKLTLPPTPNNSPTPEDKSYIIHLAICHAGNVGWDLALVKTALQSAHKVPQLRNV